jgi:hypothetical protein
MLIEIPLYSQQHYNRAVDISVMLTPCFGDIDPPHRKWFKEQTV